MSLLRSVFALGLLSAGVAHAETTVKKTGDSVRVTTTRSDWAVSSEGLFQRLSQSLKSFYIVQSVESYAVANEATVKEDNGGRRLSRDRFVILRFRRDSRLPALMFKLAEQETTCGTEDEECAPSATTQITGPLKAFDRVAQVRDPLLELRGAQLLSLSASGVSGDIVANSQFQVKKDSFEAGLARFLKTYTATQQPPTQTQTLGFVAGLLQHVHKKVVTP